MEALIEMPDSLAISQLSRSGKANGKTVAKEATYTFQLSEVTRHTPERLFRKFPQIVLSQTDFVYHLKKGATFKFIGPVESQVNRIAAFLLFLQKNYSKTFTDLHITIIADCVEEIYEAMQSLEKTYYHE